MIQNFPGAAMEEQGQENLWFQQNGATPHTSRETMQTLRGMSLGRLISRNGDLHWLSRSPDFTVSDYFSWVLIKAESVSENA